MREYTQEYKIFQHLVAIENRQERIITLLQEVKAGQSEQIVSSRVSTDIPVCTCVLTGSGEIVKVSQDCPVHWNCYALEL